ncbi:MAG TPA: SDR family NAD(P)-dependent oxidoreductase [Jatrophihabitans sp.]|nr:SDR family NAD(P)-dependent oxidoreductase [Jatrophihabitans sp.]
MNDGLPRSGGRTSRIADVVDRTLECAVVPSFTRIGYDVRSRLGHWTPISEFDLSGRVVVITGATSGLGLSAAQALLAAGASVEIIGRDPARTAAVSERLRVENPAGELGFLVADTGDLDAVRNVCDTLADRHGAIDALIHNAGALDKEYALSPQGLERTVASQVAGPFAMTALLLPLLRAGSGSRVVWVSSGGLYTQPLSVAALDGGPGSYRGAVAYARAKRAQVTLAQMWAEHLRRDRVRVHAMHPGWADTPGLRTSLPTFRRVLRPALRSPAQGVDTLVWLAADDGLPLHTTGLFWLDRRPRPIHRLSSTRRTDTADERARLWSWCVRHAGIDHFETGGSRLDGTGLRRPRR